MSKERAQREGLEDLRREDADKDTCQMQHCDRLTSRDMTLAAPTAGPLVVVPRR